MGTSKEELFTKKQIRKAKLAKAFAHPARIAILEYMVYHQQCICGDLVNEIPLAQSTLSQHLKELKEAGLIKGEIDGVKICYCINEKIWNEAMISFNEMFYSYKNKINCCADAIFEKYK
jgi:DNA-binding transcriptional ArsR family regulator